MRPFVDIRQDVRKAFTAVDLGTLKVLIAELDAMVTDQATALAENARGLIAAYNSDYSSALYHYDRSAEIYDRLGDRVNSSAVMGNVAQVYQRTGEVEQAVATMERALDAMRDVAPPGQIAAATGNLGIVYAAAGKMGLALEHYQRALAMHEELGEHARVGPILSNIASLYRDLGDYSRSLQYLHRARALYEEQGIETLDILLTSIANLHQMIGNLPAALEEALRALSISQQRADKHGEAGAHTCLGNIYFKINDLEKANEHYRLGLAINEAINNRSGIAVSIINVASNLIRQGMYDEAQSYVDRLAEIHIDSPEPRSWYERLQAQMAIHRGDLDAARAHYAAALSIINEAGFRSMEIELHEVLRDLARERGDFDGYIHHNTEYLRITEAVKGHGALQQFAAIEAEQKVEAELRERDKERALLYGALPKSVADRRLRGEDVSGDHFDHVSVLFMDIAGFTSISDRIPAGHVVYLLKAIFRVCDDVCRERGLTKIKTIGDSYLAVAGVPEPLEDHVQRAAQAAIDMLARLSALELTMDPSQGDISWTKDVGEILVRIGLHCGPLVAGIVGDERLQYDVWGDTVNVASRMESTGEPGRIQCSEAFAQQLRLQLAVAEEEGTANSNSQQRLRERGAIEVKGKGSMTTYWLEPAD